jgi:hypothetical protein
MLPYCGIALSLKLYYCTPCKRNYTLMKNRNPIENNYFIEIIEFGLLSFLTDS